MARRSFAETHRYAAAPFEAFLDQADGAGGAMDRDLAAPAIRWCAAFDGGVPIGYAKRLYRRYGFAEVGRCTFPVGNRVDDDRIWCRPMAG